MKSHTSIFLAIPLLFFISEIAFTQNAYELKKGEFYRTFDKKSKITASSGLYHMPILIDKQMNEEFFYKDRIPALLPLINVFNQYADSIGYSTSMRDSLPEKGRPYLFVGSSEAETAPGATMMMKEEHDEYPPMAIYLVKPSGDWKKHYSTVMDQHQADFAVLMWLGLTEYPKSDKGVIKKKVILGTGYEREIRLLSAVDKPVEVLQLTGVLLDKNGNVIRAGAEGILYEDSPFWVQVLNASTTIDNSAIKSLILEERRDDLPGRPLVWKVAIENLMKQLMQKT